MNQGTLTHALILAGDCDGNLGDKAIVRSTCDELHRLNPGVRISIKSNLPVDYCLQYFRATPIPKGPKGWLPMLKAAASADLVLVGGGGLFQDDDSLIKMPYWGLKVAIVRLFARRMVTYSIGAGPLRSRLGRAFAALAMACMDRISVRDHTGQAALSAVTGKPVTVVPDPAVVLQPRPGATLSPALQIVVDQSDRPIIAVALREWFHQIQTFIPHKYAVKYKLRKVPGQAERAIFYPLMAQALDEIVEKTGGTLLFVPSYNVGHEGDHECCERVMAQMRTSRHHLLLLDDPVDYVLLAKHLSLIISARLHPVILCTNAGTPAVGLGYNPKFTGYFVKLGLESRLLDLSDFQSSASADQLVSLALNTLESPPDFSATLAEEQDRLRAFNADIMRKF